MKIRSVITAGVVGATLLGIAVLLSGDATSKDAAGDKRIRVAYFPNVGHAIPIIGIERGIFEDHLPGVRIEARLFDSGPQAIESIFSGSVDIAYVGPGPAINGFLNSENGSLKILSGAASGGASFIVHPDFPDGDFDFDGKKIAAPQIGNTQDVSLRHYLSERNLKTAERGGSVVVYNIPNPDIYTLFVKGDVDGAWVAEPWATILERELGGTRLFYEEDLWPDGRFASVLLIADSDYVDENPGTVRAWLDAHDSTAGLINADKRDAGRYFNDFMADTFGRGLDQDIVDVALANIEITPDPVPGSVHAFAQRADALGYLGRDGYSLSGIFYGTDSNSGSGGGGGS